MNIWPSREFALGIIGNGHNETLAFTDGYESRVVDIVVNHVMAKFCRATALMNFPIYQVSNGLDGRVFVVMSLGADAYSDGQVILKVTHENGRGQGPVMRFEVGSYPTRQSSSNSENSERVSINKADTLLVALESQIRGFIPELIS